jgi:aminoglycoside phosphotransferase (APT) family kinase protein
MTDEPGEILHGGIANAGAVVRVGNEVVRPATANGATIHRLLRHLERSGLDIAPRPIAWTPGASERLSFVPGDVAIRPYPAWAQTDAALASITRLIRELHDATRDFVTAPEDVWNTEEADPEPGGTVVGHNDVCLENVVFRDGVAVALLDFEFAAPVRPTWDLASFARQCVPIDDDFDRQRLGWTVTWLAARLRLIVDTYGCTLSARQEIVPLLEQALAKHEAWVRRHVAAGEPGVIALWEAGGGAARFDRRREWWTRSRGTFAAAMA